jgi:hypothetical protein
MNMNMHICRLLSVVLFIACTEAIGQTSLWMSSATPVVSATDDKLAVTLGLKFYSDVAGSVTGVRFYKGPTNTGLHVGILWSNTGAKLATVTFSGETASGWQQANFSSPISIAPNTPYVISYLAPNGAYAVDKPYSWSTLNSGSLHVSGSSPGVFAYGANVFPTSSWYNSNYWVDVVFSPNRVDTSFWTSSATPILPEATDDKLAVTLGLKFYSDVAGSVTGVRFYKGLNNTGLHIGTLWSSNGTKLATLTFSGESASGWQQANFSSPISIASNTPYVISYSAPNGAYAVDKPYSWSTLNSGSLHVSGSSPGVFAYGANVFPTSSWYNSNYWVDVVFSPTGANPSNSTPTTYSISGTVSGSSATLTLSGAASGSTTTDSAGRYSFPGLANGTYVVAPSQSGYTFNPVTASAVVNGVAITGLNFTATAVPTPISHSIILSWQGSGSAGIKGYNIYRAEVAGGQFTKLNASPTATTAFSDTSVASGRTYYYVATAVDINDSESAYSNQAMAPVPTP